MSFRAALIHRWKLELRAAEAASDRLARLMHLARAARFAKRAARDMARRNTKCVSPVAAIS